MQRDRSRENYTILEEKSERMVYKFVGIAYMMIKGDYYGDTI